jgi:small subunit ribosomal protein S13
MAIRIVGVDLPQNKRGEIALTYIYGIGRSSSAKILTEAGVDKDLKVKDWTDEQAAKIREIIGAGFKVEGDLRSEVQLNIKRLMFSCTSERRSPSTLYSAPMISRILAA